MTTDQKLPILAQIAKETGTLVASMREDMKMAGATGKYPTTEADLAADKLIKERLKNEFPDIPILSEEDASEEEKKREDAYSARLLELQHESSKHEYFAVDPLDNTGGYIRGAGYSVNIGRIRDGFPVAGAVYFPAKRELFFTGDDGKAYYQKGDGDPINIRVRCIDRVLAIPGQNLRLVTLGKKHLPNLTGQYIETNESDAQRRTCGIAKGEYDISCINSKLKIWDTAGPHAVLAAAGGDLFDLKKHFIRYASGKITVPDLTVPDHFALGGDIVTAVTLVSDTPRLSQAEMRR